jgi:hypothetical protein
MTENDIKALILLADETRLVKPQHFGTLMWPVPKNKSRHMGSAPLARVAGKVLNRLAKLGYAEHHTEYDGIRRSDWGWRVTFAGSAFVRAYARDRTKALQPPASPAPRGSTSKLR